MSQTAILISLCDARLQRTNLQSKVNNEKYNDRIHESKLPAQVKLLKNQ